MKINVREAAKMFDVPERTIERWLREDGMPHHRVHGQYRFHAAELLEWATRRGVRVADEPPSSVRLGVARPKLVEALERGGIHYGVAARDREELLRWVSEHLPVAEDDRELVYDVLLAREKAGSTAIGDGIAIPHVSTPIVASIDRPVVSLCFLERPLDLGASDGAPVDVVFTLAVPTHRAHLALLARLSAALHDRKLRAALRERAAPERILALARAAEASFAASRVDDDEAEAPAADDDAAARGRA
ncbi:MAG TPA: PTS sugar transporter subunit IIA [Minicystis sp.]|nr:PTS sugar transporter subunit IIA [Minicystis sp.]